MEPQQTIETQEIEKESNLNKVTPLSKYLALLLFVLLPFIGGYIGYMYAPVKVVEVERGVIREEVSEELIGVSDNSSANTQVGIEEPDSVFVIDDLNSEIEAELIQNTLRWREWNPKSDRWNDWHSFVVSNPDELKYLGLGLFTDKIEIYRLDTVEAIFIPDSIQLDPALAITVFTEQGEAFIENGERLFVSVPVIMTGSSLAELPGFRRADLLVLGYGYITDGTKLYSLDGINQNDQIPALEGVDPDNFDFYLVNNSDHPSNVFIVSKNRVYYRDLLLDGIDFENAEFLNGNTIVKDTDTVWFASGDCHYKTYRTGSLEEIEGYIPPC